MATVSLTIEDLVNKALEEGPRFAALEAVKVASVKKSSATDLADSLDKLANEIEREAAISLGSFKEQQNEKRANMAEIIRTYVELQK